LSGRHHPHEHAQENYSRAFALGIALNVGFVLIEGYFGWRAHSLALLADAGHNLSDVLALVLAWIGAALGRLAPDERHTYGWRRASIFASLLNALVLLAAMGAMAWEALQRFSQPQPVDGATVIAVAAAGILVNGATAWLFLRGSHHDLNLRGAFLHMAGDALVSLGVVVAGALYLLQGWSWLDPAISLAIALLIFYVTWGLLRQSLHLVFDGVPSSIRLPEVSDYLMGLPGVSEVHDLHVWAMSTSEIALTVHLTLPSGHPGDAFYTEATAGLRQRFGIAHVTIQIELGDSGQECGLINHTAR
jgi:cobalt-zinc-cadmium efflux system protein